MLDAAYIEPVNVARMSGTFDLEERLRAQTTNILQEEIHNLYNLLLFVNLTNDDNLQVRINYLVYSSSIYKQICAVVFFYSQQPPVSQGLFVIKDSRLHSFRHTTLGRTSLGE
jgi:hypothetical protein